MDYTDGKSTLAAWRHRTVAKAYGDALDDAAHAWRAVNRARAWYQAATLARRRGLDIMGYEQAPDYAGMDGMLGLGPGRRTVNSLFYGQEKKPVAIDMPAQRA